MPEPKVNKTCEWALEKMYSKKNVVLCGKPATKVIFDALDPQPGGFPMCDEHFQLSQTGELVDLSNPESLNKNIDKLDADIAEARRTDASIPPVEFRGGK